MSYGSREKGATLEDEQVRADASETRFARRYSTTCVAGCQSVAPARPFRPIGGAVESRAIVIGSGFGGAVAALRLGEAGVRTVVLERGSAGRSFLPRTPSRHRRTPTDARCGSDELGR